MNKIACCLVLAAVTTAAISVSAQTNSPTRTLSLDDCIAQALKQNFDVQVERYDPQASLYNLYATYGGYDPVLTLSGQHNYNVSPGSQSSATAITASTPAATLDGNSFDGGISGVLPEGLQYGISGSVYKNTLSAFNTNDIKSAIDNSGGSIGITLDQPLLKNFWIDDTRLQIKIAKITLKQSEQGLRAQLITTISAVENAYYELIYARENLQVEQEALELAQTQLDQDKQRMQIGTLAQLSVEQDESQVAQSRANLITAQFTLVSDENALKNLITDSYRSLEGIHIEPSDPLTAIEQPFDLQDSWNKGMTLRPDLLQAQLTLEQQGIQLKFNRNQLYPELDLVGSYGYNGAGQTYNDVFGQYQDQNSPFWNYGAKMSIPLSNVSARNNLKSEKVTEQQDLLKLKQLEQSILVDIDDAVKQAQSALESVDATKEARIYAEAALDAEQKTYAVGKATTFEVLQYQNDLTSARSQEIRALANYAEALSNLSQQEGSTLQARGLDIEVK